jgi:hypothetical protein
MHNKGERGEKISQLQLVYLKYLLNATACRVVRDRTFVLQLNKAVNVNPGIQRVWLNLSENAFVRNEKRCNLCSQNDSLSPD